MARAAAVALVAHTLAGEIQPRIADESEKTAAAKTDNRGAAVQLTADEIRAGYP
jgi:hypothetical protein